MRSELTLTLDRNDSTRPRSLGVNRITVLIAYDELAAESWITVRTELRPSTACEGS